MKKQVVFFTIILMAIGLIACSSDENDETDNGLEAVGAQENDAEENANEENGEQNGGNADSEENETAMNDEEGNDEEATESETDDTPENIIATDIEAIFEEVKENDLLDEDITEIEDVDLDWGVTELMDFPGKSITTHEDKMFFSYSMNTYSIDMDELTFSDKIDAYSDAQMVAYDDQLVFLTAKGEEIFLYYLDPETDEVDNKVTDDLARGIDAPLKSTFLHGDKLIGLSDLANNIYVFDLASQSLEKVVTTEDVLGDEMDLSVIGFEDDLLYVGSKGIVTIVYAIDVDAEEVVWQTKLGEDNIVTKMNLKPREAIFEGDSLHLFLNEEAYIELDKNTGDVLNGAFFGVVSKMVHFSEDSILMVMESNPRGLEPMLVSLERETMEPQWAKSIESTRTFSSEVHDGDLYLALLNHHGTNLLKMDADTGEIVQKDTVEELDSKREGVFLDINNGKIFMSDAHSLAITSLE